jgi:hypothetical protein
VLPLVAYGRRGRSNSLAIIFLFAQPTISSGFPNCFPSRHFIFDVARHGVKSNVRSKNEGSGPVHTPYPPRGRGGGVSIPTPACLSVSQDEKVFSWGNTRTTLFLLLGAILPWGAYE